MKLTTNRKQLLTALDIVSGAIMKRSVIPIFQNVLLMAENDGLYVTGTDLETFIQTRIPATLDGMTLGTMTVPFVRMQTFVKLLKSDIVSIESQELTHKVNMSADSASITIDGMSSDSYPTIPNFGQDEKFPTKDILDIESSAWFDMVSKVRFVISRKESLNGFLLDVNGAVRMVATDGHRLSLVQRDDTSETPHVTALIPARGADQLKRIFGKGNHSLNIKRTVCPDVLNARGKFEPAPQFWIVRSRDTTVSGRILTGNFPDYERAMPHYEGQHAKLSASDLLAGIEAVYSSADEISHVIQFHFNDFTVKLIASTDGSASSIEIPCETGVAHDVSVEFNADYVRDFVKSLRKDDSVYISCAGLKEAIQSLEIDAVADVLGNNELAEEKRRKSAANRAWGFSSELDSGYKHVIMPVFSPKYNK